MIKTNNKLRHLVQRLNFKFLFISSKSAKYQSRYDFLNFKFHFHFETSYIFNCVFLHNTKMALVSFLNCTLQLKLQYHKHAQHGTSPYLRECSFAVEALEAGLVVGALVS